MMLIISPMSIEDLPSVMELEQESFSTPWSLDAFAAELERDISHFHVAREEEGGAVLGFICFWTLMDEAHILNIAVNKEYRRRGVGRALAIGALKAARRLGAKTATLEVREKNRPATGLYEGLGFVRAGLRVGYYEKPNDNAVIMWHYDIGSLA